VLEHVGAPFFLAAAAKKKRDEEAQAAPPAAEAGLKRAQEEEEQRLKEAEAKRQLEEEKERSLLNPKSWTVKLAWLVFYCDISREDRASSGFACILLHPWNTCILSLLYLILGVSDRASNFYLKIENTLRRRGITFLREDRASIPVYDSDH
jgi:hypothetical protein